MNQYQVFLANNREVIVNAPNHSAALETVARAYKGVQVTGWTLIEEAQEVPADDEPEEG